MLHPLFFISVSRSILLVDVSGCNAGTGAMFGAHIEISLHFHDHAAFDLFRQGVDCIDPCPRCPTLPQRVSLGDRPHTRRPITRHTPARTVPGLSLGSRPFARSTFLDRHHRCKPGQRSVWVQGIKRLLGSA